MATLAHPLARLRSLFLANVGLQALDGWVTFAGVTRGFPEGNPLVAGAMSSVGPMWGIAVVKLIAIGLLWLVYRRGGDGHPLVEPGLTSVAFTYVVLAVIPWMVILAGSPR